MQLPTTEIYRKKDFSLFILIFFILFLSYVNHGVYATFKFVRSLFFGLKIILILRLDKEVRDIINITLAEEEKVGTRVILELYVFKLFLIKLQR